MKVVVCRPGENAEIVEIGDSLEATQAVVGGYIEAIYPFEDQVAIVCNEEGKCNGSRACRALCDDKGEVQDIICGTFFICGCEGKRFASLSNEMLSKYKEKFQMAERYFKNVLHEKITVIKYDAASEPDEVLRIGGFKFKKIF